jgi:hypothetical protein
VLEIAVQSTAEFTAAGDERAIALAHLCTVMTAVKPSTGGSPPMMS